MTASAIISRRILLLQLIDLCFQLGGVCLVERKQAIVLLHRAGLVFIQCVENPKIVACFDKPRTKFETLQIRLDRILYLIVGIVRVA
jgi:hypothetical protein